MMIKTYELVWFLIFSEKDEEVGVALVETLSILVNVNSRSPA
jgi:hypothetical protein